MIRKNGPCVSANTVRGAKYWQIRGFAFPLLHRTRQQRSQQAQAECRPQMRYQISRLPRSTCLFSWIVTGSECSHGLAWLFELKLIRRLAGLKPLDVQFSLTSGSRYWVFRFISFEQSEWRAQGTRSNNVHVGQTTDISPMVLSHPIWACEACCDRWVVWASTGKSIQLL